MRKWTYRLVRYDADRRWIIVEQSGPYEVEIPDDKSFTEWIVDQHLGDSIELTLDPPNQQEDWERERWGRIRGL